MLTNFRSRVVGYGLAATALTGLAAPIALIGTAGPASASASCGTTVSDRDSRSWPRQTSGVSANQRSGSSTGCGITGYADNRNVLDYHCYTATATSTWTYLRNDTDGTSGWVSDSLLPLNSDGETRGSLVYCGF